MIKTMALYLRTVGFRGYLRSIACKLTKSTSYFTVKRSDCRYPFQVRILSSDIPTCGQVFFDHDYDFMTAGHVFKKGVSISI